MGQFHLILSSPCNQSTVALSLLSLMLLQKRAGVDLTHPEKRSQRFSHDSLMARMPADAFPDHRPRNDRRHHGGRAPEGSQGLQFPPW
jgi:hypothetical protein